MRFVSRQEDLLPYHWPLKTRWLSETTLGDFTTRCRWEYARQTAKKQNRPVDLAMGFVIGLLFYGETVSHSSDSFPPMLAVDPAGGSSSDDRFTDTRKSGGLGINRVGEACRS